MTFVAMSSWFLCGLFGQGGLELHDDASGVSSAGWAGAVGHHWLLALGAGRKHQLFERKMRGAAVFVRTCTAMSRKSHRANDMTRMTAP